jgi:four helix bundle protein
MRSHEKLRAFQFADQLAIAVYEQTRDFPPEERYGLTAQIRRAAVSVASNIVEGCARHTEVEYLRFLDVAYGSARELEYQLSLAYRLHYLPETKYGAIEDLCSQACKTLHGLIRSMRSR